MATGHLPLLLVDGLLVQQHTDIMDYDAKRIKKVNLSREDCVINSITFNGIIAMETVAGNFYQEISRDYVRAVELFPPLPKKKYFTQTYGTATISDQGQIPDFREQLLWLPHLVVGKGVNQVEFYTSDVAGQYGVYVEGFTDNGDPVSWRETFEVVP